MSNQRKSTESSDQDPAAERCTSGRWVPINFTSSDTYWEQRYKLGGNSGAGSSGRLAEFKAEILNKFVAHHKIASVIEFGSVDGDQLLLANYPSYTGVDVSRTAVVRCKKVFGRDPSKVFFSTTEYDKRRAKLSLSLDVIYHLVEDETFNAYMHMLFEASERYVIVYASNWDEQPNAKHVRHRKFTDWVSANRSSFKLIKHIPNRFPFDRDNTAATSFADFYIFELRKRARLRRRFETTLSNIRSAIRGKHC